MDGEVSLNRTGNVPEVMMSSCTGMMMMMVVVIVSNYDTLVEM